MSNATMIIRAVLLTCWLSATAITARCQEVAPMQVTATADSTTLIMGDRTTVNVEVIKNVHEGALLTLPPKDKDYYGLELTDCVTDSADLGNGRIQLTYRMTFQAFDPSELLTLPGFRYASQGDTVTSGILTFKVLPVELRPELGDVNDIESLTINPDEPVTSIPLRWYDYVPDWTVWVLIGIAVVALLITLYVLYKKNGPKIFVARKPTPPYELAIESLNKLKDKRLIERGMAKQFYTEVTDIWRRYLEGRFGITAMEMTSRQILRQLRDNRETHLTADQMEQLLELSDFVKFAAMNPTQDEMHKAYNTIYTFVENTRPQPEEDEASATRKDKKDL